MPIWGQCNFVYIPRKDPPNSLIAGKYFLTMALMAQNWSLFIQVMTRDADFMCNFFTPSFNFLALSIMAMKAVVLGEFLVFPVIEGYWDTHIEVHNFWTGIFKCFRQNIRCDYEESQTQNHCQATMHSESSFWQHADHETQCNLSLRIDFQ